MSERKEYKKWALTALKEWKGKIASALKGSPGENDARRYSSAFVLQYLQRRSHTYNTDTFCFRFP